MRPVALRRIAVGLILALVVGFAGAAVAFRAAYGTSAFWGPPERITWCGRHYLRSEAAPRSRAQIEADPVALPGDEPYPVVQVARVPPVVGRPVLAAVTPEASRQPAGLPCTMELHLEVASDRYLSYSLSGGP